MVLPASSPHQKGKKKGKRRGEGDNVQVNIVVDPSMFSPSDPNSDDTTRPRQKSMFEKIALETRVRRARRRLKRIMFLDVVMALLWSGVFVWILMGERCPVGGFVGW